MTFSAFLAPPQPGPTRRTRPGRPRPTGLPGRVERVARRASPIRRNELPDSRVPPLYQRVPGDFAGSIPYPRVNCERRSNAAPTSGRRRLAAPGFAKVRAVPPPRWRDAGFDANDSDRCIKLPGQGLSRIRKTNAAPLAPKRYRADMVLSVLTCRLTALWDRPSYSAAAVKLAYFAADSKQRGTTRLGNFETGVMPRIYRQKNHP